MIGLCSFSLTIISLQKENTLMLPINKGYTVSNPIILDYRSFTCNLAFYCISNIPLSRRFQKVKNNQIQS